MCAHGAICAFMCVPLEFHCTAEHSTLPKHNLNNGNCCWPTCTVRGMCRLEQEGNERSSFSGIIVSESVSVPVQVVLGSGHERGTPKQPVHAHACADTRCEQSFFVLSSGLNSDMPSSLNVSPLTPLTHKKKKNLYHQTRLGSDQQATANPSHSVISPR
mmetsp:Transcript_33726/g.65148  ORF Transcript_33726/g.65148 Transcript_33726/m.65148 type:complete len:159 (-) Transcript_33726:669-1145(-)